MKNKYLVTLLLMLFFTSTRIAAQISLTGMLPLGTAYNLVKPIEFEFAGTKLCYLDKAVNTITLFNTDLSIYKVITIPPQPFGYSVFYLSEQLFDADPATFEYLIYYTDNVMPQPNFYVRIYTENGSLLFSKDQAIVGGGSSDLLGRTGYAEPFFTVGGITYMVVTRATGSSVTLPPRTWIFQLPGHIYCRPCGPGLGLLSNNEGDNLKMEGNEGFGLFSAPNPAKNYTRVFYELPEDAASGELIFYNMNGEEVKQFEVDKLFTYIQISTNELPAGTYSYKIHTLVGDSKGKQLVVIQ